MSCASRRWARARVAALIVPGALVAALSLSACGGGSGSGAQSASGTSSDYIVKSDDEVTKTESAPIETGHYPAGHDTDEENATGKKHVKPCTLVSVRKAESILGPNVSRTEHLQGPTCIYSGSGREISLTLQEASLRTLREGARKATPVKVGSHKGWCLRYEKSSVAVAIHPHEVLVVGGSCQAGVPFAAAALSML
jgi:hypothetical protein